MKVFVSWSGGKDSMLALFHVHNDLGKKVVSLLNMMSEDGTHSRTHGISTRLLKEQAEALSIPLLQQKTTWKTYRENFIKAVARLKEDGVEGGVFGDIDLQPHRDWVESVCRETGLQPFFPLWQQKRTAIMDAFIQAGFKSIVIATRAAKMNASWLGRDINERFLLDLAKEKDIDLCGEAGEYHTFVYAGPLFKKPVSFTAGEIFNRDDHWLLNLSASEDD